MAKITKISYERIKNLGNYENCKVQAEASVDASEKPDEIFDALKVFVEKQIAKAARG